MTNKMLWQMPYKEGAWWINLYHTGPHKGELVIKDADLNAVFTENVKLHYEEEPTILEIMGFSKFARDWIEGKSNV